ncbi:hypothetical protein [Sphaerisporangium rufum]|nr:hypothetical protein [Sphaerisporangium rufum]
MEHLTIAILLAVLGGGAFCARRDRQGSAAVRPISAEFPLPPGLAADIVAEAALTERERTRGGPVPVTHGAGRCRVEVACRAGAMVFEVRPLPGAAGSRVVARAEQVSVIPLPDIAGAGSAAELPNRMAGLPRHPARLLRRREQAFHALSTAARAVPGRAG